MPLDITEYSNLASDGNGNIIPTGLEPSRAVQQIPVTGTASSPASLDSVTRFVRLHTDTTCRIRFSTDGAAADATAQRMPAGATEFFGVKPSTKISVISST